MRTSVLVLVTSIWYDLLKNEAGGGIILAKKKSVFKGCVFVGQGEEDVKDIIRRQFIRHVNEEKGYAYLAEDTGTRPKRQKRA